MERDSAHLHFAPLTEADTDDILRWRNSEEVRKYFLYREDFTREGQKQWLKERVKTGQAAQFIVSERAGGRRIGSVYIRDIDQKAGSGEYGIFIGETDCRGCGYGTECAAFMIKYAFEELGLSRLFLRVLADNGRAIRSYEKAGFLPDPGRTCEVKVDGSAIKVLFMEISVDRYRGKNLG